MLKMLLQLGCLPAWLFRMHYFHRCVETSGGPQEISPTGSFRAYTFWTLSEALSRLYQRRFLRPRPHFSAFFKLYIFSFAPFQISVIFQPFAPLFAKFIDFLRILNRFSKKTADFTDFQRISSNFCRN